MKVVAKQKRSKDRISIIIKTAITIIETEGLESLTIAEISKKSGLKRTSTYKFIPTPNALKELVINECVDQCIKSISKDTSMVANHDQVVGATNNIVLKMYNFFVSSLVSQRIILGHTINPPIDSDSIHKLGHLVEKEFEKYISLDSIFNKSGVCRVVAQIILSIFSLNTKESGALNEVGKIEANRAVIAYIKSWLNK